MNRVQRTKQRRLEFRRRSTALALITFALVMTVGVAIEVLSVVDARASGQTAQAMAAQSAAPVPQAATAALIAPDTTATPQPVATTQPPATPQLTPPAQPPATVQPTAAIQPTTTTQPTATSQPTTTPQPTQPAGAQTAATKYQPFTPPSHDTAQPPAPAATGEPQLQANAAQQTLLAAQPKTRAVYSLMPADFLHDDLTGTEAPALQRLLKRWGFSDEGLHSGWQAVDAYHLSLYQRWADLKPTGSVDTATRRSLLATWQKYADRTIPRKRLPLEGRYIGVNPGHQNRNFDRAITPDNDERFSDITIGTRGRVTGLYEYELNLAVALKVRDALLAQGARVLLSRTSNDVRVSNSSRTRKINSEQVDAVLLIHADGNASPSLHGLHMIVSTEVSRQRGGVLDQSHKLARALQGACIAATGAKDMGVGERDNLRILLSGCAMPAALIEMGYMTNPAEDRLLATDAYQNKIVSGLVQGFLDYFKQ